jgi:hypothetical protein
MRSSATAAAVLLWCAAFGGVVVTSGTQSPVPNAGEFRPPPPPEQPIPFSHKGHALAGIECLECHQTARTDDWATLPSEASCMSCHKIERKDAAAIQRLADFASRGQAVPWRRVYRLPEYVYFSHAVHLASERMIGCPTCHGAVDEMEVVQKVKDTSMAACTECHKQHSAPILCDSCHERL